MKIDKEKLITEISPLLKANKYKKRGTTWIKKSDDDNAIYVLVNLQSSQYDANNYYLNFGVYIRDLGKKEVPTCISDCHMQQRIESDISSSDDFMLIVKKWEQWYGSYDLIYSKVVNNNMPMLTDKRVCAYFLVSKPHSS